LQPFSSGSNTEILWISNSLSGGDREQDEVPAVGDPTDMVQIDRVNACPLVKVSGVWPSNDAWQRAAL
jgi:hypothetical protein